MQHAKDLIKIGFMATGFALAGATSRFLFQYIETRWQITVFVAIAMMIEVTAQDRQLKANWLQCACNCLAAVSAIIAVKWSLEGVSPLVREFL